MAVDTDKRIEHEPQFYRIAYLSMCIGKPPKLSKTVRRSPISKGSIVMVMHTDGVRAKHLPGRRGLIQEEAVRKS